MLIKRELYNRIEPYITSREAIIVTGMRRVGKTTLLRFIYNQINSDNKIFLDLENPLNQRYFEQIDFEQIKFTFETLKIDFGQPAFIFLDEIQLVKNIPQVVKYFIDHYAVKFFLSGSASYYLKNLFSESLAGRKYIFELFPCSFKEFLAFKQAELNLPKKHAQITKPIYETIQRYYKEYMEFGGFPQVILEDSIVEKQQSLNDIFSSYFQLEVRQLSDFKKTNKVRDLIFLLMQRTGSKLDVKKLAEELGISRATLADYLGFLEGTYFLKLVRPYSKSSDVEIRKTPKVYFCDSGLVNQTAKVDQGILFEQNIFQNLRLQGNVNYYQRKSGAEIDFILDKKQAFEVKVSPTASDLKRVGALSQSLGLDSYRLVSLSYTPLDNTVYGFEI